VRRGCRVLSLATPSCGLALTFVPLALFFSMMGSFHLSRKGRFFFFAESSQHPSTFSLLRPHNEPYPSPSAPRAFFPCTLSQISPHFSFPSLDLPRGKLGPLRREQPAPISQRVSGIFWILSATTPTTLVRPYFSLSLLSCFVWESSSRCGQPRTIPSVFS